MLRAASVRFVFRPRGGVHAAGGGAPGGPPGAGASVPRSRTGLVRLGGRLSGRRAQCPTGESSHKNNGQKGQVNGSERLYPMLARQGLCAQSQRTKRARPHQAQPRLRIPDCAGPRCTPGQYSYGLVVSLPPPLTFGVVGPSGAGGKQVVVGRHGHRRGRSTGPRGVGLQGARAISRRN